MNYIEHLILIRDRMQREIIHKVVSNAIESDRTMEFNDLQEFPTENDSGHPIRVFLQGIDCNTGKLFDNNNNIVGYHEIPLEILSVIHYIITQSEEYTFKPIMFI